MRWPSCPPGRYGEESPSLGRSLTCHSFYGRLVGTGIQRRPDSFLAFSSSLSGRGPLRVSWRSRPSSTLCWDQSAYPAPFPFIVFVADTDGQGRLALLPG